MIRAKFEDGKLPIPQNIIQKAGLKEGDEVEVGLEDGIVIIKPLIDKEKFVNELKGCVEISKINPLEVKNIWKA
jgi:bifunctional DNA-binding transcriptional regulator/antitoxin component of YhaV-PrlF toxin-antitoxin module